MKLLMEIDSLSDLLYIAAVLLLAVGGSIANALKKSRERREQRRAQQAGVPPAAQAPKSAPPQPFPKVPPPGRRPAVARPALARPAPPPVAKAQPPRRKPTPPPVPGRRQPVPVSVLKEEGIARVVIEAPAATMSPAKPTEKVPARPAGNVRASERSRIPVLGLSMAPADWRRAIILNEILQPPVSLR